MRIYGRLLVAGNELVAFGEVRHGTVDLSRAPASRGPLGLGQ